MPSPRTRIASSAVFVLLAVLLAGAGADDTPVDPQRALEEGNRLFRDGRLEDAARAYRAGYTPASPHPTLAYNLGATLHRLGRLPEAVLWYRRAPGSEDPWQQENLFLARRSLGTQVVAPDGPIAAVGRHHRWLERIGIGLAWAAFLVVVLRPATARMTVAALVLAAVVLWGVGRGLERWGLQQVVLLDACRGETSEIPAGTEAWARRRGDGDWRIAGTGGTVCPDGAVEAVFPR